MLSSTPAQDDAARDFESRIEGQFDDDSALGLIRAEIIGADLSDFDRESLLGRIEQYGVDRQNMADGLKMEGTDGRVGGSSS